MNGTGQGINYIDKGNKNFYTDEYYPHFGFFADYQHLLQYFSCPENGAKDKCRFNYYFVPNDNSNVLMNVEGAQEFVLKSTTDFPPQTNSK
ncbi:hypothetical protein [Xenorhabdus lircayensis]|uniref:Uncharacterized protein n=1 Tax=Xenorhabdus lircayensis TaxID=2763499 RepID=A0ABS0U8K8_9GAMM|nr:hypothetical protein [Xenorhabdus lircayensis]MBI6550203.1 hypothetical protein [Xenorhabdus lircayensis]